MLQKSEIKISSHFALKKNVDFALPREKIVTTPIIPMENDSQYKNVEYTSIGHIEGHHVVERRVGPVTVDLNHFWISLI